MILTIDTQKDSPKELRRIATLLTQLADENDSKSSYTMESQDVTPSPDLFKSFDQEAPTTSPKTNDPDNYQILPY